MGNMDNMPVGFIWADVPEVAHLHAGQLGSASRWAAVARQLGMGSWALGLGSSHVGHRPPSPASRAPELDYIDSLEAWSTNTRRDSYTR